MSNWTATTSTAWIFFDSSHTEQRKEGSEGENIVVYVEPATSPTDEKEGTITISYDGDTIVKTITRCVPEVLKKVNSLEFKVSINDEIIYPNGFFATVTPCEHRTNEDIIFSSIKLKTVTTLSNGSETAEYKDLTIDDINVYYIIGGSRTTNVPKNMGTFRNVNVFVEYKADTSVNITLNNLFGQDGIKNSSAEYDYNMNYITNTAYTDSSFTYSDFDIDDRCKNLTGDTTGGTKDYFYVGNKTQIFGVKTGLTICGDAVNIAAGSIGDTTPIPSEEVSWRVKENNGVDSFNEDVLTYGENDTLEDRDITIVATLIPTGEEKETNFKIPKREGGSTTYYIMASVNKNVIESSGASDIEFTYYVTMTEGGGEDTAIKDNIVLEKLLLTWAGANVSITKTETNNGVKKSTVKIGAYQSEREMPFYVSCDGYAEQKEIDILQLEAGYTLLPNCLYLTFNYKWKDSEGRNLDTLHVLTCDNMPIKNLFGTPINGVGAEPGSSEIFSNNVSLMKYGGNNYCAVEPTANPSGKTEASIALIDNIISKMPENTNLFYIDTYANWYESDSAYRGGGNIERVWHKLIDHIEGGEKGYNNDIQTNPAYCNGTNMVAEYVERANSGRVVKEESYKTAVGSRGTFTHTFALRYVEDTVASISHIGDCINKIYSHISRFVYNKKYNALYYKHTFDNADGIDSLGRNYEGFILIEVKQTTYVNAYEFLNYLYEPIPDNDNKIIFKDFKIKRYLNSLNPNQSDIFYVFSNQNNYIKMTLEKVNGSKVTETYTYADVNSSTSVEKTLTNDGAKVKVLVRKNSDNSVNITITDANGNNFSKFISGEYILYLNFFCIDAATLNCDNTVLPFNSIVIRKIPA